jgi:putative acetyltransferase
MLNIRQYHISDLDQVVELWYESWCKTFPFLQHTHKYLVLKSRFINEILIDCEVWIAEIENRIVGFVAVNLAEIEINQIFIDLNYQNQGIGSLLIQKAKELCPQGLKLTVLQINQRACWFYEKHGFTPTNMSINKINGQPNIEYFWLPDRNY